MTNCILEHSGYVSADFCPVIGCLRGREVRVQLDWIYGRRRVVSGCELHVALLAAREITRAVQARGGQEAVVEMVDGLTA